MNPLTDYFYYTKQKFVRQILVILFEIGGYTALFYINWKIAFCIMALQISAAFKNGPIK